jgi:hypothetical protein
VRARELLTTSAGTVSALASQAAFRGGNHGNHATPGVVFDDRDADAGGMRGGGGVGVEGPKKGSRDKDATKNTSSEMNKTHLLSANAARTTPATDLHEGIKCCFFCTQILEELSKYLHALKRLEALSRSARLGETSAAFLN